MRKWAIPLLLLVALAACAPFSGYRSVALLADGETRGISTRALTVRDLLAEASVTLDEDDRVVPVEPSFVEDGMTIRVIRVEHHTETLRRVLAFERRTVLDASIPSGETRLLERGEAGVEELTYRVTIANGEQIERTLVQRILRQEPRSEIVLIGGQVDLAPASIRGTVAYIADRNIWLMQGTSTNQRRLTHSGDLDGQVFRLTSDGSQVLFTRATTDTVAQAADEAAPLPFNSLWMVDTAPGGATPVQVEVENVLWADWEPGCNRGSVGEGCRIAYATGTPAAGNPGWRAENDLWIARLSPLDGGLLDEQRIVEPSSGGAYGWWGTTYAWSPDGHQLAYARADEIGAVDVPSGTSTTLLRFPPYRTYAPWVWMPTLSWSQDGRFLITALHTPAPSDGSPEDSLEFDIWAISIDSTINAHLVDDAGMWAAPQCAHQGDAVVYGQARDPAASRTSGYDLYVMDRDGSDQRRLFPPAQEIGLDYPAVAWDPSGGRLVAIYRGDVYLITLEDGQASPLTAGGGATAIQWR